MLIESSMMSRMLGFACAAAAALPTKSSVSSATATHASIAQATPAAKATDLWLKRFMSVSSSLSSFSVD
jgi:hypothetical protein